MLALETRALRCGGPDPLLGRLNVRRIVQPVIRIVARASQLSEFGANLCPRNRRALRLLSKRDGRRAEY